MEIEYRRPVELDEKHWHLFWEKVLLQKASDGCWIWTSGIKRGNYGSFNLGDNRSSVSAHCISYEALRGRRIKGLDLDHLCRNPLCVNPWHLEQVSRAENLRRGRNKNGQKTECIRGHRLAGENLYYSKRGSRQCKECAKINSRAYKARKKSERLAAKNQTLE